MIIILTMHLKTLLIRRKLSEHFQLFILVYMCVCGLDKNHGKKIAIKRHCQITCLKPVRYIPLLFLKIILHDPEEEPDVNNKGFISSPGMSTYVSMKMTKVQ